MISLCKKCPGYIDCRYIENGKSCLSTQCEECHHLATDDCPYGYDKVGCEDDTVNVGGIVKAMLSIKEKNNDQ